MKFSGRITALLLALAVIMSGCAKKAELPPQEENIGTASEATAEKAESPVDIPTETDGVKDEKPKEEKPKEAAETNIPVKEEVLPEPEEPPKEETIGEAAPEVPQREENETVKIENLCTLSVSCSSILSDISRLDEAKRGILPADGVIFKEQKIEFNEGETVFDLLLRVMKENKIHMEYVNTPMYKSAYIEGIGNIYEFDAGELSGWMYRVNGIFPNYGCSRYVLKPGDAVEFVYTCDLGKDVGGEYNSNNGG